MPVSSSPRALSRLSTAALSTASLSASLPDPADETLVPPVDDQLAGVDGDDAIPVPSARDRHLLSRFSFGITREMITAAEEAGGAREWFRGQLDPGAIPDRDAADIVSWWPTVTASYDVKHAAHESGEMLPFEQEFCFLRWLLLHRIGTRRQVESVMTDFWSNILFIPSPTTKTFEWRPDYERTIRRNALGTYVDLLTAAVLHPAMLFYLDNANSTASAPNENLGRELLELHTVGRAVGYTESDVRSSMRILTGYRVRAEGDYDTYYSPDDHATGRVRVLGFEHANDDRDGRALVRDYLRYLALHPATARKIAFRLVRRFVHDDPAPRMVADVADAYLRSGSDIRATLRALVDHPDFFTGAGVKVRTPVEDFVNTYRVLDIQVHAPSRDPDCAAAMVLFACAGMGQRPFDWPRPDGFPETGEAWSSPSRMLGSWRLHKNAATAQWPSIGIWYQPLEHWLPSLPCTVEAIVNRVSRLVLAMAPSEQMLTTVCKAIGATPDTVVEDGSPIHRNKITLILQAVLDTPEHMSR